MDNKGHGLYLCMWFKGGSVIRYICGVEIRHLSDLPVVSLDDYKVEAVWRKAIAHSTVVKDSRIGYSIGLNYPPDWGEQTVSVHPGDKTVLQPNMTLHLIPSIWYEAVGFEIDASIRITSTGYESLYDYPLELFLQE